MSNRRALVMLVFAVSIAQSSIPVHGESQTASATDRSNQNKASLQTSEVAIFLNPKGYVERQYTKLDYSAADFSYPQGEEIVFHLDLKNRGSESVSFRTNDTADAPGIRVELGVMREEQWTPVTAVFKRVAEPSLQVGIQASRLPVGGAVELPEGALLSLGSWTIAKPLSPDIYQLRITRINSSCEPACRIANQAGVLRFEVRSSEELAAKLELIFRQAYRALDDSDLAKVNGSIKEMLRLHPSSLVAQQLKGDYSKRVGDRAEAAKAYAEALRLLDARGDTLFLWNNDPGGRIHHTLSQALREVSARKR